MKSLLGYAMGSRHGLKGFIINFFITLLFIFAFNLFFLMIFSLLDTPNGQFGGTYEGFSIIIGAYVFYCFMKNVLSFGTANGAPRKCFIIASCLLCILCSAIVSILVQFANLATAAIFEENTDVNFLTLANVLVADNDRITKKFLIMGFYIMFAIEVLSFCFALFFLAVKNRFNGKAAFFSAGGILLLVYNLFFSNGASFFTITDNALEDFEHYNEYWIYNGTSTSLSVLLLSISLPIFILYVLIMRRSPCRGVQ